ncbi:MAG: hypothetical protein ACPL0C_05465 [Candidatus Bathyarchaeales archaeon]
MKLKEMLYAGNPNRMIKRHIILGENSEEKTLKRIEAFFSIASLGFLLILLGAIFASTPSLYDEIIAFFKDFEIVEIQNTQIYLPAPAHPQKHLTVYSAAETFCLIWSIYEIAILITRFFAHSPTNKKAETLSNIIFWLGTSYLIKTSLNTTTTTTKWFTFWTLIITLLGISLIVRGLILAAATWQKRKT